MTQTNRPRLWFGLTAWPAALPVFAVMNVLQRAPVLEAVVVNAGQVNVSCCQRACSKQLVGNLEEVLSLPNPWRRADNAITYSSWGRKKNKATYGLEIWCFLNYLNVKLTETRSEFIISFDF